VNSEAMQLMLVGHMIMTINMANVVGYVQILYRTFFFFLAVVK